MDDRRGPIENRKNNSGLQLILYLDVGIVEDFEIGGEKDTKVIRKIV